MRSSSPAGGEDAHPARLSAAAQRDQASLQGRTTRSALQRPLPQNRPAPRDFAADERQRQGGGRHWKIPGSVER